MLSCCQHLRGGLGTRTVKPASRKASIKSARASALRMQSDEHEHETMKRLNVSSIPHTKKSCTVQEIQKHQKNSNACAVVAKHVELKFAGPGTLRRRLRLVQTSSRSAPWSRLSDRSKTRQNLGLASVGDHNAQICASDRHPHSDSNRIDMRVKFV